MVVAGSTQLQNPYFHLGTVYSYGMLSKELGLVIGSVIPFALIVSGLCFLCCHHIRGASVISVLLFGSFLVAQLFVKLEGIDIECGCFGPSYNTSKVGLASILRSIVLLATPFVILFLARAKAYP